MLGALRLMPNLPSPEHPWQARFQCAARQPASFEFTRNRMAAWGLCQPVTSAFLCTTNPWILRVARRLLTRYGGPGFRVCVRTQNSHVFVAPAFRRALWNQAHARLKAGATRTKTEFSHRLFSPDVRVRVFR